MIDASLQTLATPDMMLEPVPILGGETAITLTAAGTLQSLGVQLVPLGTAMLDSQAPDLVAHFPISGGTVGPAPDIAILLHQGSGLELASDLGTIDLRDFRIDTLNHLVDANVTVDGDFAGNLPVFSLGEDGTTLSLSPQAAEAVAGLLGVHVSLTELAIGLAAPSPIVDPAQFHPAPDAETQPLIGGDTLVTLTSAETLAALGIQVGLLGSAGLDASGPYPVADFPVTGGTAGPGSDAVILHQDSGLTLSTTTGTLELRDFLIDTLNHVVDADVAVNGQAAGNLPLFDIGEDASLTLTPLAAAAANAALGTTAITPEVVIGTAAPMPEPFIA